MSQAIRQQTSAESDWKNILWREWYYCGDKAYAKRLYQTIYTDLQSSSWFDRYTLEQQHRPFVAEVESALRQACTVLPRARDMWKNRLDHLDQLKTGPILLDRFITDLQGQHWDRFIARHVLLYCGGQAVEPLSRLVITSGPLQRTARWLLDSIRHDTTVRLAERTAEILCPNCLIRFGPHRLPHQPDVTFYGCRACRQSRNILEGIHHIVGVLDVAEPDEQIRQGDTLYVNWLQRRNLFDFDRVEIIQASDEEVERFAVQVGNDTDPYRKPRYSQMTCRVGPDCDLSENTLRILGRMFGKVEHQTGVMHESIGG